MDFDACFERLLGHEGGLVDHAADPGGLTKYGISQRSYPGEDIRGMTVGRAQTIYRRDYWGPAGCDAVPEAIKFDLFDMAVNAGVRTAVRCLQRAAGADADGILGPRTLLAVQSMPATRLLARFNGSRLAALTELPTWPAFGKGWCRRIAVNLMDA
jgi:lysozyme family protein